MLVRFLVADVFAERPFAGNQLCVVPDGDAVPEGLMPALASEIGFSETTFVTEASPGDYRMRIFTPAKELPFAGHPSLGTAFSLAWLGRVGERVTQHVAAGDYPIEVDLVAGRAAMDQGVATFGPAVEDGAALAAALGLDPADLRDDVPLEAVSTGNRQIIALATSEDAVRRASPSGPALRPLLQAADADGVYLAAFDANGGALARAFFADLEIEEDPATGSAAGPLGAFLSAHAGLEGSLTIRQGEQVGRPSVLEVDVERTAAGQRVRVAGGVFVVAEGAFMVGDT